MRSFQEALRHRVSSRTFLIIASLGIGALNLLAISYGAMVQQILATLLLAVSVYPTWRYLRRGESNIPFVPLIAIIYGVYYGLPLLLPFDRYLTFRSLAEKDVIAAQVIALMGLSILLLTFYRVPKNMWRGLLPQLSVEWCRSKAMHLAIVLAIIGISGNFFFSFVDVPLALGTLLTICQQMGLVAIAILYLLQLRAQLPLMAQLLLWVVLIPLQILVDLGSGYIFPIVRFVVMLFMIYLLIKRKIPWRWNLMALPVILLLLATKTDFRALTWDQGHTSDDNPIEKGVLFLQVSGSFLAGADLDRVYSSLEAAAQRMDLISVFSYVVEKTPDGIPYWGGQSYTAILWKVVPRMLCPDKPLEFMGQSFGHRYSLIGPADFTTSVNFPQLIEMYVNFGIVGVAVGMFMLGLLYRVLYHVLNYGKARSWGLISSAIIFSGLINIESNFTLVYGGIIYWIFLLYGFGVIVRQR